MTYSGPRDPSFGRSIRNDKVEVTGSMPLVVGGLAVLAVIFGLAFYFNDGSGTNTANMQRSAPTTTGSGGGAR